MYFRSTSSMLPRSNKSKLINKYTAKNKIKLKFNKTMYGGGEKLGIFLSRHRSAWKRRESYVNQGVAKNDVNPSFVR